MTTDWERVKSLTEKDIERAASSDPDAPLLTKEELTGFKRTEDNIFDKTYCASDNCKNKCGRKMDNELKQLLAQFFPRRPISYSEFCDEFGNVKEKYNEPR